MLKGLVLAVAGFLLFLLAHVVLFRLYVPTRRFMALVRLAVLIGLGIIFVHRATGPRMGFLPPMPTAAGWAVDLLNGLLVYAFLFIGYCMFYFLVDRGFSGRILIEIETAPDRRQRQADIAARYSMELVMRRRLSDMLDIGQIVEVDGRWCTTAKGRRAARVFAFVKRFLQLGQGG